MTARGVSILAIALIGCGGEATSNGGAPASQGDWSVAAAQDIHSDDMPEPPQQDDASTADVMEIDTTPPVEDAIEPPPPDTDPGPDAPATGTSFQAVFDQVISPNGCTAGYCHGGGAGGLTMQDQASAYEALVGVAAAQSVCGLTTRVVPGSPDESVLWIRARPMSQDAGGACAEKMPQGSEGLTDKEAAVVRAWIEAGAPK